MSYAKSPRWGELTVSTEELETREGRTDEGDLILDWCCAAIYSADDMGMRPKDADDVIAAVKRLEWALSSKPKA